jgi:hypothetical protein
MRENIRLNLDTLINAVELYSDFQQEDNMQTIDVFFDYISYSLIKCRTIR